MGRGYDEQPRLTYMSIVEGQFCEKNHGTKSYCKNLSGHLVGVKFRDGEEAKYGPEIHVGLHDGNETFLIQMRLSGGYAIAFMKAIENVDLTKPVTLYPWYHVKDDQKAGGMNIFQNGAKIQWKYTKDTPHGIPEWSEYTDGDGVARKSKGPQVLFLRKMMEEVVAPKMVDAAAFLAADIQAGRLGAVPPAEIASASMNDMPAATSLASDRTGEMPQGADDENDLPF